ncbi:uncharacterized protein LOC125601739 [Brassica napus]|uniref:uncharacterized protein LOC125601739 n=1 Tax=Brassica napus TaxID=3708 RepID=UPI0020790B9D|nr:uncharacterized protein LOC125601739 [Brassica napus]
MNDLQLLGEINSPTSFNFLELQGCAAPAVNNSRNPNPQISATNEIVPEEIESEATSAQTKSVVPPIVAAQQNIEQPNAQPPRLPTVPEEGVKSKVALWKDKVKPNSGKFEPKKAPARGAVHAIVNGMWSKHRRDISVSKMDGKAFLFRVPCPNARRRILNQCLWQVDGQTMFVAKWSPGVKPEKPSLSTVPVWLDLTGVPLQFFNEDALKEIASLVGHPICLHPSTENLTNLEVAKVYTVIDPRQPLPEAVNAQFESGEVVRIQVSSPWLPSLCSHCSKVGHTISKCPNAPPRCEFCRSVKHSSEACPRSTVPQESNVPKRNGKAPIASQFPIVGTGNDKGPGIARATPKALPKEKPKASAPPPASNKKGKRQNNKQWAPTEGNKRTDADSRAQMYQAGPSTDPKTITLDLEEGEICVDLRPINLDPGKVWLLWHPSVSVSVLQKSLQCITCSVKLPFVSTEFAVTLVYGSNHRKVRRELWSELSFLSSSTHISHVPWTVLGDFNQILEPSEHSSANAPSSSRGMRDFFNCTVTAGLSDLPYCGNSFTWSNNQGASVISKKLDRILVNDEWLRQFPNSLGVFGDPGISDHSPCCVYLDTTVSRKLKELKSIIRSFSKENYSGIEKRVVEAFATLTECQRILLSSPTPQAGIDERLAFENGLFLLRLRSLSSSRNLVLLGLIKETPIPPSTIGN